MKSKTSSNSQLKTANSWYQASLGQRAYKAPAAENAQTRVCVVGAGFAGLATAIGLYERGFTDVVVVDAGEVGHGASGRNGGFVFGGYSLSPQALVKQQGEIRARQMYELTTSALNIIRQRTNSYSIDCQFKDTGIIMADWFGQDHKLRQEQAFMNDVLGANWEFVPRAELSTQLSSARYYSGLLEPDGAHFHPLAYANGLADKLNTAGIPVWTHSPVTEIKPRQKETGKGWLVKAQTASGEIRLQADTVIMACGGYQKIQALPPARAILPIATYIMVTEPLGEILDTLIKPEWAVYDTRFAFDYYRPLADKRLLWGGRISIRDPDKTAIESLLRKDLKTVFPGLAGVKADYVWSGLMGYPRHQMPMIGESEPGLWHLTGFGGHGVAPTTALGELMAATLSENDTRYQWFGNYNLKSVYGSAGMLAAQLNYWYLQYRDYLNDPQR